MNNEQVESFYCYVLSAGFGTLKLPGCAVDATRGTCLPDGTGCSDGKANLSFNAIHPTEVFNNLHPHCQHLRRSISFHLFAPQHSMTFTGITVNRTRSLQATGMIECTGQAVLICSCCGLFVRIGGAWSLKKHKPYQLDHLDYDIL